MSGQPQLRAPSRADSTHEFVCTLAHVRLLHKRICRDCIRGAQERDRCREGRPHHERTRELGETSKRISSVPVFIPRGDRWTATSAAARATAPSWTPSSPSPWTATSRTCSRDEPKRCVVDRAQEVVLQCLLAQGKLDGKRDPVFPDWLKSHKSGPAEFSGSGVTWIRPASLKEAFAALERPHSRAVASNLSVGIYKDDAAAKAQVLVDVSHLPELRGSRVDDKGLTVGAAVSLTGLMSLLRSTAAKQAADKVLSVLSWKRLPHARCSLVTSGGLVRASGAERVPRGERARAQRWHDRGQPDPGQDARVRVGPGHGPAGSRGLGHPHLGRRRSYHRLHGLLPQLAPPARRCVGCLGCLPACPCFSFDIAALLLL